ncbi:hypothetical protein Tco_0745091 [Tanacetum coccineum]
MDSSFTLDSTEEAYNVRILQSCNGLLLYCSLDNSPCYRSAGLRMGMNFLESYGYMDPMLILIQIPHLLHLEEKLFKSRGCLLLVCRDDSGSSEFTIYEMMIGCYVWTVRYRVDTDDFMTLLLEGWSIRSTVWSIVLGKKEDDSFLVINLSRKVVQYNLISKTLHEIYDCGSNQLDDNHDDDDELLRQFEAKHNVYEFILSFASV